MPDLFGIDIAGIVNDELGSGLLDLTLIKQTSIARVPGNLSAGMNPSTAEYPGKGFISDYLDREVDGTQVITGDRKVCILGKSVSVIPSAGDMVTIEGNTHNIIRVKRDPAAAMYTCQVRGKSNA